MRQCALALPSCPDRATARLPTSGRFSAGGQHVTGHEVGLWGIQRQHGIANTRVCLCRAPRRCSLPEDFAMAARLPAWPLRGELPCGRRAYHRTRDALLIFSSPSFSSSLLSVLSSPPPPSLPPSHSLLSSPVRSLRRFTTVGGVKRRAYRAPLFVPSNPPPQDFPAQDHRAWYSTGSTMTATKIDGTAIAKSIREGLKSEIEQIQQSNPRFVPSLVIFQSRCS